MSIAENRSETPKTLDRRGTVLRRGKQMKGPINVFSAYRVGIFRSVHDGLVPFSVFLICYPAFACVRKQVTAVRYSLLAALEFEAAFGSAIKSSIARIRPTLSASRYFINRLVYGNCGVFSVCHAIPASPPVVAVRTEFATTRRLLTAMSSTASKGLIMPNAASGIAMAL